MAEINELRARIKQLETQNQRLKSVLRDVTNIAVFPPLGPQVKEILQRVEVLLNLEI